VIDDYLASLDEPKRSTLEELRKTIIEIVPGAEHGSSASRPDSGGDWSWAGDDGVPTREAGDPVVTKSLPPPILPKRP
jgi:hypothetical protein